MTTYDGLMQEARDRLFFDQYNEALALYIKASYVGSTDEEKSLALFEAADIYSRLDQYERSHGIYKYLADRFPTACGAYYGIAYTLDQLEGDLEDVAYYYDKAIELDPNYDRAYFYGGHVYDRLGQKEKALDYWTKVVELMPFDFVTWNDMAAVAEELGRYTEALVFVEKSLEIFPKYVRARYNLGVIYYRLGRYEDAEEAYLICLMLDSDEKYYLNLSAMYIELKEYVRSRNILKLGLKEYPASVNLWYNLACAHVLLGDFVKGEVAILKAISLRGAVLAWIQKDEDLLPILDKVNERFKVKRT